MPFMNNIFQERLCTNRLRLTALMSMLLAACGTPVSPVSTPAAIPGGKYIIAYYPSWAAERDVLVKDIPAGKLTHINYAFSNLSADGECILGDSQADVERLFTAAESVNHKDDSQKAAFHGNFNQLLELKALFPHIKVLISIGGWSWSGNFSSAAWDDSSRDRMVSSCIQLYLKQYKGVFDGIDIDWEYPVSGGLTTGRGEDKKNYLLLLSEFRRQLDELGRAEKRHYLLTIAAPVGPGNIQNMGAENIAVQVDWINLMGYDFHSTWDSATNFNAPLFRTPGDPADAGLNVDAAIQTYLAEGFPAGKLVLGVPFYGHGWSGVPEADHGLYQAADGAAPGTWESGSYDYRDIRDNYLPTYRRYWDADAQVPWLYDPVSRIFISYDDPQSIAAKAGYARDLGLAGVMIWEISQGDETLLDAIHQGFESGGPPRPTPAPTTLVPRPFEKEIHKVDGITVDGRLNDWSDTADFFLTTKTQIVYSLNPNSWTGVQDLSMLAWAGWTSEGMYFAFAVVDDAHLQPDADSNLWHGDHVELQFDTLLDKDYTNPGMNDDDYQVGLSTGDFAGVPPVAYAWFNGPEPPGVVSKIQMAFTRTEDGYFLEAFLPREVLVGISLEDGATFGMNISLSDADTPPSGQEVMLSTSAIRTYANPMTFGRIILVK